MSRPQFSSRATNTATSLPHQLAQDGEVGADVYVRSSMSSDVRDFPVEWVLIRHPGDQVINPSKPGLYFFPAPSYSFAQ